MVTAPDLLREMLTAIQSGGRYWLFLDYDGTLAGFSPTPADIFPDSALNDLLARLARFSDALRLVILSGRKLEQLRQLIPVPGILLAGTYGLEYLPPGGQPVQLLDRDTYRLLTERVLPLWKDLVQGRDGFFIEDKGFSLALHAKYASGGDVDWVLPKAREAAIKAAGANFQLLEGPRFLEIAPLDANKGRAVLMLMHRFEWPGAGLAYFGDDARDEEAFKVVAAQGGTAVLVAPVERPTAADARVESPVEVREWLSRLAEKLESPPIS
jgi:trehalose-phosphatase